MLIQLKHFADSHHHLHTHTEPEGRWIVLMTPDGIIQQNTQTEQEHVLQYLCLMR